MSLKELNLSWNHLRQDGAVALGAALSVSRFQLYMSSICCCKHVRNGLIYRDFSLSILYLNSYVKDSQLFCELYSIQFSLYAFLCLQ